MARVDEIVADEYVERPAVYDLWMAQARIELAEHRGEPVSHRWTELADGWRRLGWPMPAAVAEFRSADALLVSTGGRTASDRAAAAQLLDRARTTATDLGSEPLAAEIDDLARRARIELGGGTTAEGPASAGTPDELPFGLTPREVEVLALVTDGCSNGEIGIRLFVSTKTASVHVSNILRKLDASNRIEAAAIARRHGFLEQQPD
jgi:DNA-binding CsgD family transcriptional regulator